MAANVVFVAPYYMYITARFVDAAASLPGINLGLVTSQPIEVLPAEVRKQLAGHYRTANCLDPGQIKEAVTVLSKTMGPPDRLIGVLEQIQEPLGRVRDELGIPGMSEHVAANFRDKARMKEILQKHGVPCARYVLASRPEDAWKLVEIAGFPMVVKPPAGAGAKSTFRVDNPEQLEEALAVEPPTTARPWMMEEFITGEEQSFDTVSVGGRPVWHSLTHYLPTPLDAIRNPWIQWCVALPREIDGPVYDDIRRVAFKALEVLGMETGFTHMEWFRREDGSVAVSEVAARPPGAGITMLMSHAHGFDFYKAWIHLMVFAEFTAPERRYAAGAAFLRGQGQGRVKAVHGVQRVTREIGDLVVETKLPRPGQPRSSSYEGEGYIIVRHPRTDAVLEALRRIVSTIKVEVA